MRVVSSPENRTRLCFGERGVPSLFVLGCMKCATTTLHKSFVNSCGTQVEEGRALSDEAWTRAKEKHFFDRNDSYARGLGRYASHFSTCASGYVGLDSTQAYGKTAAVPGRLMSTYGTEAAARASFAIVVREPVARYHSNYWHRARGEKAFARDYPDFDAWAYAQLAEAEACGTDAPLFGRCGVHRSGVSDGLWAGLYAEHVEAWLATGFRPDRFVVLAFSRVVADPTAAARAILEHTGLDTLKCGPGSKMKQKKAFDADKKYNQKTPRNATIASDLRTALDVFYEPHSDALVRLIARRGLRVEALRAVDYAPCAAPGPRDAARCPWPY